MPNSSDNGPPAGDVIHIVDPNLRHGFAQVPRPILKARDLSDKAKIVYALLLDYAWQEGSCFPGQETLAQDLATSDRTIRRALDELKAAKLIAWKQRGLSQTNVYYILNIAESAIWMAEPQPPEPDRTKLSSQDRSNLSTPKRTKMSATDRTQMADKEYPADHTQSEEYSTRLHLNTRHNLGDLSPSKLEKAYTKERNTEEEPEDEVSGTPSLTQRGGGFEPLRSVLSRSRVARAYQPVRRPALASEETTPRAARSNRGEGPASASRLHQPRPGADAEQAIRVDLERYAEELGDEAALSSSLTRALRLYEASGLTIGGFLGQMGDARRETLRRSGGIRKERQRQGPGPLKNRMPYFFRLLEDYLGLKEQLPSQVAPTTPRASARQPRPPVPENRHPEQPRSRGRTVGGPYVRVIPQRDDESSEPAEDPLFSP